MSPEPGIAHRTYSVGIRLAIMMAAVLATASVVTFLELTSRERAHLLNAKTQAATMVADLFAASVSPALDFQDLDALAGEVRHLQSTRDLIYVVVSEIDSAVPLAEWKSDPTFAPPSVQPPPSGISVTDDWVKVSRPILDQNGRKLGETSILFSLEPENVIYQQSRRRMFWQSIGLALGTAILLGAIVRKQILLPLAQLAGAARRLQRGDASEPVVIKSRNEIGELGDAFNLMGQAVTDRATRLTKELDIATRIQTSILPRELAVEGLEIVAQMTPTSEVGGDYYDVLPTDGGCWIGIGDVSGHGLNSGLIMMMIQSMVAALVRNQPEMSPSNLVCAVNDALVDNIRVRLAGNDHATLTMIRYHRDGRLVFAGAHEDMLIRRAENGQVEGIETPGTWVGAIKGVERAMTESSIQLRDGDVIVLYTDGVTEAMDSQHRCFGIERLRSYLASTKECSVDAICNGILREIRSWMDVQFDDITVLVLRYRSPIGLPRPAIA